jgi:hypothetical protein
MQFRRCYTTADAASLLLPFELRRCAASLLLLLYQCGCYTNAGVTA